MRIAPGGTTDVVFVGDGPGGLDLAASLVGSLTRQGWTADEAERALVVGADGTGRATFRVHAPADALPGQVAFLTVRGAAFPTAAVLVVGGPAEPLPPLLDPAAPDLRDRVVRPWTLHLQGSTQGTSPTSDRPILPGRLVPLAPGGSANDTVRVAFASGGGERRAAGVWRSEPLAATTNVSGLVRAELWATWTDVEGLRLVALVGADPLPLDWTGDAAPPGTLALRGLQAQTSPSNAGPPKVLAAEGTAAGLPVARGERLAVALYFEKTGGQGVAVARAFGREAPSKLIAGVEEPVFPTPIPAVAPHGGVATFSTAYASPAGFDAFRGAEARVGPAGGASETLALAATVRTMQVGTGTDRALPAVTGSFSTVGDVGTRETARITVSPDAARLVVALAGDHAQDRFTDHDLDLEVFRGSGAGRAFVKAARAEGPAERIELTFEDLDRHGRGAYEVDVLFDRAGTATDATVDYTLTFQEKGTDSIPGAWLATSWLWPHAGRPVGDYALTTTLEDGRGPTRRAETSFRLTPLGPTLPPTADFSFSPVAPVSGQAVEFRDHSADADGALARRLWEFGDGTNATTPAPTHAYARPGRYEVRLTVWDDFDAVALASRTLDVGNAPPVAAFRAEPTVGVAGEPVRFIDESSDADGVIADRLWSFGDGTGSAETAPAHTYAEPGTYNVSLTVFDEPRSFLGGATITRPFVVLEPGARTDRPIPDFEPPLNPVAGRAVRFTDRSFWPEGPLEYHWEFGDRTASNLSNPLHTYTEAGTYLVSLAVRPVGRADLESSVARTVVVAPAGDLAPFFRWSPPQPTTAARVRFEDATPVAGAPDTRLWEFGDGSSARGNTTDHVYPRPGAYTVRLTVFLPDGGQATTERVVEVARGAAPARAPPADLATGGLAWHRDAYIAGTEHLEAYADTWRREEISGRAGNDYLATGTRAAYLEGSVPATPSMARWIGGGLTASGPIGATTSLLEGNVVHRFGAAEVRAPPPTVAFLGNRPVDLSGLATTMPAEDDLSDGLLLAETALEGGGVEVRRSLTLLEGTLHADVRTTMHGGADQPMRLVTEVVLPAPAGTWIATGEEDQARVLPAAGADNVTLDLGGRPNRWVAAYSPATLDVAGVVIAGDATGLTLTRVGDSVVVRVDHVGLGRVVAAEYLVAYRVADPDATRYAGVMTLAAQDASEIGVAYLADGRAAAVAWTTPRADLAVSTGRGLFTILGTRGSSWTLAIDAPEEAAGKVMRLVMPAEMIDRGLEIAIDGDAVSPLDYRARADDATLVLEVPIPHFSLRTVTVRAGSAGVSPAWLWVAIGLAAVVGAESWFLARRRGWSPKSEAELAPLAARETPPPEPPAELDDSDVKEALLKKLKG
ncbi:MAG TPA: PKD domain-containing protein [Candidatus Thermoplasmatota archaeon]|nr:PKD domain-containing protein [Candidatus Thermoplasmatota archaeon]